MGTTSEKLLYLNQTKADIKTAIEGKGVVVNDIPFRDYAGKINQIDTGGGNAQVDITSPTEGQETSTDFTTNFKYGNADKIVVKVDDQEVQTINFQHALSGLGLGNHTIRVEAHDGLNLIDFKTKNIQVVAPGLDADYENYLDFLTTQSIALPDSTQRSIDNDLLISYKNTGAWSTRDVFLKFSGTAVPAAKLVCWKRLIKVNAYGSLVWSNNGVKGNGTNAYIDSLFTPSVNGVNWKTHDVGIGYSIFDLGEGARRLVCGAYSGVTDDYLMVAPTYDSNGLLGMNSPFLETSVFLKAGFTSVNRFDNTEDSTLNSTQFVDNITQVNRAGINITSRSVHILARNTNGSAALFSTLGLGHISFGASLYGIHDQVKTLF